MLSHPSSFPNETTHLDMQHLIMKSSKVSTHQGSDFLVVFSTARQESSWVLCMQEQCAMFEYLSWKVLIRAASIYEYSTHFSCLKLSISILLIIIRALFWILTYCTAGNEWPDLSCPQTWRYNASHMFGGCISGCPLLFQGFFYKLESHCKMRLIL